MKHLTQISIVAWIALATLTAGCGDSSGGLLKGVAIESYEESSQTYLELTTQLNTGGGTFSAIDLGIYNPNDQTQQLGKLGIHPILSGGVEVVVAVNMTLALQTSSGSTNTLPNGALIPIGGLGSTQVIGLPLGSGAGMIYLAYGEGVAMLGYALTIKEFNSIGATIGSANIFPAFDFGNGITGIAGIFTSFEKNKSGIALFVDASSALSGTQSLATKLSSSVQSVRGFGAQDKPANNLKFYTPAVDEDAQNTINYSLYRISKKRMTLHVLH